MIKFENYEVFNIKGALRGMRNPMNSWDKSDSYSFINDEILVECGNPEWEHVIGKNDMELCKKLIKGGSEHRKFIRQIFVSVDITAPLYFWKEFDTYKIGTTSDSCSTMHTIHKKEFTINDFSHEHLKDFEDYKNEYGLYVAWFKMCLYETIDKLNVARKLYLQTGDKIYWWQMIQLLPTSYNQMRTITMNYEVLLNICKQRKGHKLDEWNKFIEWCDKLPYFKEFKGVDE